MRQGSLLLACLLLPAALVAACGGHNQAIQPQGALASASAVASTIAPPAGTEAPPAGAAPSAVPGPAPSVATPAGTPSVTQPGPGEWGTWSHDKKLTWMKFGVMPKMSQAFHDVDPARYAEPRCGLCHGAGAKDGSFKMPNPDLPKLPKTPADFMKLAAAKPKVFAFMKDVVSPQMAALLGEQPFDMKTGKGFGCMECHTQK